MHPTNVIKAILLKVASALIFAVMAALVRYLGAGYPVGQVVFYRSAFAIVPVVVIYAWRRELEAAIRIGRPFGHAGRGLTAIGGMFCNFSALARLPIVDATAISFAAPLITVAMAALLLKERVRIYRWSAVVVGFLGVLVMLLPHLDLGGSTAASAGAAAGAAFGLSGAFFSALSIIQTRHLTKSETTSSIADLHAGRPRHPAVRLEHADLAGTRGAHRNRHLRRARPHRAHRELSLRAGLAGSAVRLYVDAVGAGARLSGVRRVSDRARVPGRRHHRRSRAIRDLARAPLARRARDDHAITSSS
jgi:hypothetical protein